MTVDDNSLLQANATVVAGILIFLTLALFSKSVSIKQKSGILLTVMLTLTPLIVSVTTLLFWSLTSGGLTVFAVSRIGFILGLFGVGFTIYVVSREIPKSLLESV